MGKCHDVKGVLNGHITRGEQSYERVSIHHNLGFNWHPLEGAGTG